MAARKVSMKFGSLTTATTPGGSGNGNSSLTAGVVNGTVNIVTVEDYPETEEAGTIYLIKRYVWDSTTKNLTGFKVSSVDHLPPDPDPNVMYFIRRQ